nr:peptide-methionine (S)-S-oxide reductase MsrA [uncultured Roseococcus sp.]
MDHVTKTPMRRRGLLLAGAALTLAAVGTGWAAGRQGTAAPTLPDPAQENSAPATAVSETAVLAGGCFWGVQGVFQHLEGVSAAVSGYAGGEADTANYRRVSGGASGHAEAVRVTFDPRVVSFGRILQVFFSVAHDPTQLNRQGPDVGTQYRSAIFPQSPEQARVARAYIAQLNAARIFDAAIVTRLEADRPFYPAEDYHQDYMTRNPTQPYIAIHDLPKIGELRRVFPDRFRAAPILVSAR